MTEYVVKAAPDAAVYLIWSTVVDAPTWIFESRDALVEHLRPADLAYEGHPFNAEQRAVRADVHGTSALTPTRLYGWDDDAFDLGAGSPKDGYWYELPRVNLLAYAKALLANDVAAQEVLLRRAGKYGEDD